MAELILRASAVVMSMGMMLAYAGMLEEKNVSWIPSADRRCGRHRQLCRGGHRR